MRLLFSGVIVATVAGLFGRTLLANFALQFRVDDPTRSDALVVLLGGTDHRPARAAELYRAGLAPLILLGDSGTQPSTGANESRFTREVLIRQGVPRDAIRILDGKVTSTREEAQRILAFSRMHPLRTVTVVTSAYHTRRARWIFRKAFQGRGVRVHSAAAREPRFDERSWYRSDEGLVAYFNEALKTIYYWLSY